MPRFGQASAVMEQELARLAADLVRMDSRSILSNLAVAELSRAAELFAGLLDGDAGT